MEIEIKENNVTESVLSDTQVAVAESPETKKRKPAPARFDRFSAGPDDGNEDQDAAKSTSLLGRRFGKNGASAASRVATHSPVSQPLPIRASVPGVTDRPGALRGAIVLRLHTHAAQKLWKGRNLDRDAGKQGIKSIPHFAAQLKLMTTSAAKDDPYADWWLIQMQDDMNKCRTQLRELSEALDKFMREQMPDEVQLVEALSQQPLELEIRFEAPMAYQAAYLLADFDKLARRVLMVRHYGLLARAQSEQLLDQGARVIRALLSRIDGWRYTGVTRDDMAANNQRAQTARSRMGECPADVLRGDRRSDIAPPIRRESGLMALGVAQQGATDQAART